MKTHYLLSWKNYICNSGIAKAATHGGFKFLPVKEYFLFIDTETSGLPKKWNAPYSDNENWPSVIQIAWIVYNSDKQLIKQENHYLKDGDFKITSASYKIHGLTKSFLDSHGENRKDILLLLQQDLLFFQPLVIGHFVQFDCNMLGVEFYRAGIENPLLNFPRFCTMLATNHLVQNPTKKYMRLFDLYEFLFEKKLEKEHNALMDASATADCFFELLHRGEIDENKIAIQPQEFNETVTPATKTSSFILISFILFLLLLIVYSLWKAGLIF